MLLQPTNLKCGLLILVYIKLGSLWRGLLITQDMGQSPLRSQNVNPWNSHSLLTGTHYSVQRTGWTTNGHRWGGYYQTESL